MSAGLFELRKDAVTGWWVATVVDRTFHRDRFRLTAGQVGGDCQNCREPAGDGVRLRTSTRGTGRPLLIISGLGARLELAEPFEREIIAHGIQVIGFDR